jgi:hypothetical protein
MSRTRVKPHRRTGTRGVRGHVRILKARSPEAERINRIEGLTDDDIALIPLDEPDNIYIYNGRDLGPKHAVPVISHEELHRALHRIGEKEGSFGIDVNSEKRAYLYPDAGGLFRMRRQR